MTVLAPYGVLSLTLQSCTLYQNSYSLACSVTVPMQPTASPSQPRTYLLNKKDHKMMQVAARDVLPPSTKKGYFLMIKMLTFEDSHFYLRNFQTTIDTAYKSPINKLSYAVSIVV